MVNSLSWGVNAPSYAPEMSIPRIKAGINSQTTNQPHSLVFCHHIWIDLPSSASGNTLEHECRSDTSGSALPERTESFTKFDAHCRILKDSYHAIVLARETLIQLESFYDHIAEIFVSVPVINL
jgi:hypothetical protein